MKAKLLSIVGLSLFLAMGGIQAYAQENEPKSKTQQWKDSIVALRSQSKQEQERIDSLEHLRATRAILVKDFVLEGGELVLKHGERGIVNSTTNFVALHDGVATVQISPFESEAGPNGVGGITVEGTASNVKVDMDKKGNVTLTMSVSGIAISAQVIVHLWRSGGWASATVSPNFNSFTTTLNGKLVPFAESSVFKGSSL